MYDPTLESIVAREVAAVVRHVLDTIGETLDDPPSNTACAIMGSIACWLLALAYGPKREDVIEAATVGINETVDRMERNGEPNASSE